MRSPRHMVGLKHHAIAGLYSYGNWEVTAPTKQSDEPTTRWISAFVLGWLPDLDALPAANAANYAETNR